MPSREAMEDIRIFDDNLHKLIESARSRAEKNVGPLGLRALSVADIKEAKWVMDYFWKKGT